MTPSQWRSGENQNTDLGLFGADPDEAPSDQEVLSKRDSPGVGRQGQDGVQGVSDPRRRSQHTHRHHLHTHTHTHRDQFLQPGNNRQNVRHAGTDAAGTGC